MGYAMMNVPVIAREGGYTSVWSVEHIHGHHHSWIPWQQLDYAKLGPVRQFWHRSQRSIPLLTLLRCDQQAAEASTQIDCTSSFWTNFWI